MTQVLASEMPTDLSEQISELLLETDVDLVWKAKIALLDLDDTLIEYDTPILKPDALEAVKAMHEAGNILVLCSHHSDAWRLTCNVGLAQYITHNVSGCQAQNKLWNLKKATECTGKTIEDMILFDDDPDTVTSFRELGMRVCRIGSRGLHIGQVIKYGLLLFHEVFGYCLGHLC